MDMMAEELGMDPFEFRYKNICREGDKNINSYVYPQYPMEKIMDTMRPIYEKAVADAKAADTPEKRRGVGIAWGGFNVTEGGGDSAELLLSLCQATRSANTTHGMQWARVLQPVLW